MGDKYDVTSATGMTAARQEQLMQDLAAPTADEEARLATLLDDPELAAHWREWAGEEPGTQSEAI